MIPMPPLKAWLAIGAVIALLAGVAYAFHRHQGAVDQFGTQRFRSGQADRQAAWDAEKKQQLANALEQARSNAQETKRRLERQQENQHAQDLELARARRDAAAAASAVGRLQQRAADLAGAAGCGSAGDSAIECVRQAARQIGDVLGQCAERHRQLALAADDARTRGLKCERDYDALMPALASQ